MYFFDPTSGRRRRLLLRDQCARAAKSIDLRTRDARHKVSDRTLALIPSARHAGRDRRSDRAVFKDMRKAVRECASHPESIALAVDDGHVILRGNVFSHEHQLLLDEVRAIPGVRVVTDHLIDRLGDGQFSLEAGHRFQTAAAPTGWSIAGRVVAGCAGGMLLIWGARERNAIGEFGASVGDRVSRFYKERSDRWREPLKEAGEAATETFAGAADSVKTTAKEAVERAEGARGAIEEYARTRQRPSDGSAVPAAGLSS